MPKVSGGVASPKAKKSPGRHRGGKRLHGDFVHKKGAKNDEEIVALSKGEEEMVSKSFETNKKLYDEIDLRSKISSKISNAIKKLLGEKE